LKQSKSPFVKILFEENEILSLLEEIPWEKLFNETAEIENLKTFENFLKGLEQGKSLNEFFCIPLKEKHAKKFVEIVSNFLNRLVFLQREKHSITKSEEENAMSELHEVFAFPLEEEEVNLTEENKMILLNEYKTIPTETILSLYKTIGKLSEQIYLNLSSNLNSNSPKDSSYNPIRFFSAFSRLSSFVSFPNFLNKISAFDLAEKGFFLDHTLYNELKFFGHEFLRSLNFNKIKNQNTLDELINSEFPFNFGSLPNINPNVELSFSLNSLPANFHSNPEDDKTFKIEKTAKSNFDEFLLTVSKNGILNIWDTGLFANFLGFLNVFSSFKPVENFAKIHKFFSKENLNKNLKSLSEVLNEISFFETEEKAEKNENEKNRKKRKNRKKSQRRFRQ
jgi:hypothetical protein